MPFHPFTQKWYQYDKLKNGNVDLNVYVYLVSIDMANFITMN